ncbi:MAG: metalloprotease TldD [Rickettsiales bacterium]|jgi:TldD protein|nr:metalloprotease TldD [Rickettsiales bacterium]
MLLNINDACFFSKNNWTKDVCQNLVTQILDGFDDGELYLQESQSEMLVYDDQKVNNASFNISKGFGMRGVLGDVASFAHSTDLSEEALKKAGEVVRSIKRFAQPVHMAIDAGNKKHSLYQALDPIKEVDFQEKINIAKNIDEYVRSKNPFVKQVTVRIGGGRSIISILKTLSEEYSDIRPITHLSISVVLAKDGKLEAGGDSAGARKAYHDLFIPENWQAMADRALDMAMTNLQAEPAPAGEFKVVLGPGDPGVLLHEAVGHGLEGDFNRMKTSAFSESMGKRVASKGVTVIDDGTISNRRGSLNFDDEGTSTQRNILIEDGVLVSYMQDRMNARLMNMKPTGNGRRENYAHQPMPRMTNTFMLSGDTAQEDMIASVKNGIYFPKFNGGQVDITSGKFVFESANAFLIEDGKVTRPIKGASLIGNGPDVMKKIEAIGNDLSLDRGAGMCGKNGQSVPVGIGQPSLLIEKITVGGTKV